MDHSLRQIERKERERESNFPLRRLSLPTISLVPTLFRFRAFETCTTKSSSKLEQSSHPNGNIASWKTDDDLKIEKFLSVLS